MMNNGGEKPVECCACSGMSLWRAPRESVHCCDTTFMNTTSTFWAISIEFHLLDVSECPNKLPDCHYEFCHKQKYLFWKCAS